MSLHDSTVFLVTMRLYRRVECVYQGADGLSIGLVVVGWSGLFGLSGKWFRLMSDGT